MRSPDELAALVRSTHWRFETARMAFRGENRRVPDVYAEAMSLLREGTDGGRQQAARIFQAILDSAPEFAEGHFQLARIHALAGAPDKARPFAANAAAMDAENLNYFALHVAMQAAAGDIAAAARAVRTSARARELGADQSAADDRLVTDFVDEYLTLVLPDHALHNGRLWPLHAVIDEVVAEWRDEGGKPDAPAARRLQQVLEFHPAWAEARFWLAEMARRSGQTERAHALCEQGERLRTMDWPLWMVSGAVKAARGNVPQALAHFEEAALINEHLPAHAPADLTADGARALVAWHEDTLNALPLAPGAYSRPWRYPDLPQIALHPRADAHPTFQPREAVRDLVDGIARTSAWWTLARNDVLARYRRTFLGPWWTVAGTGIGLVGMALVWSVIFRLSAAEFFPYLSAGYAVWLFIAATLTEGCQAFTDGTAQAIQKNMNLPRFIHVMRLVARNVIIFAHTLSIYLVGAAVFGVTVSAATLLAIPGILLLIANGLWAACLFGLAGARYRDLAPAVGALLTVTFFVTPVIWKADMLRERAYLADLNPFTHLIAIVRDPLMGAAPPPIAWQTALALCVVGWIGAILAYARARRRIIYWL